jgi:hypothetical protein
MRGSGGVVGGDQPPASELPAAWLRVRLLPAASRRSCCKCITLPAGLCHRYGLVVGWMAYNASLVHSLAWPAGVVIAVLVLRKPIGQPWLAPAAESWPPSSWNLTGSWTRYAAIFSGARTCLSYLLVHRQSHRRRR